MNGIYRIEHEWQQLKFQELGGQMFDYEYDLAIAVMDAVAARTDRGGYVTQRFRFNAPERALINEDAISFAGAQGNRKF
jgi:hypothetical protein